MQTLDKNESCSNTHRIESLLSEYRELKKSTTVIDDATSKIYLDSFEKHECWIPVFEILTQVLGTKPGHCEENYIRLSRAQNVYVEDVFAAAETCANLVKNLQVSYLRFQSEMLPQIVERDDYIAEATILQAVSLEFGSQSDQICCLERLCMLYEKKTYNEPQLAATYDQLLKKDKKNIKALRYFKLVNSQNQNWEKVANILQELMESITHKQEKYRIAQELAAVMLYHLDQPDDTIKIINSCCNGSPLDASTIRYDAFHRLRDWKSCLDVLHHKLSKSQLASEEDAENGDANDASKAVICHKIADIHLVLKNNADAVSYYKKSLDYRPDFLDSIEQLISLALDQNAWADVVLWLTQLKGQAKDPDNISTIEATIHRIECALGAHKT